MLREVKYAGGEVCAASNSFRSRNFIIRSNIDILVIIEMWKCDELLFPVEFVLYISG